MYTGIFRTAEQVDSDLLHDEFVEQASSQLQAMHPDSDPLEEWSGVCVMGDEENYVDLLDKLPALSDLLDRIGRDDVVKIYYLRLKAGAHMHRHRDSEGNLLFGIARLHAPLKTNPDAYLEINRVKHHLEAGQLWAMSTSALHAAGNDGDDDRIHLVIDVKRSESTRRFFPKTDVSVVRHLAVFCAVASWKVARDLVKQPKSLLTRLGYYLPKRPSASAST